MSKQVLIPLVSLALGVVDSFLELRAEPGLSDNQDCFQLLQQGSLKTAVCLARQALQTLPAINFSNSIYLASGNVALSSSSGAGLALTLSPWLTRAEFPYQRSIVMGTLVFSRPPGQSIQIASGGYIKEKLQAVLRLGYQIEPTLLIMSAQVNDLNLTDIYQTLAEKNIAVRTVATLYDAYRAVATTEMPCSQ